MKEEPSSDTYMKTIFPCYWNRQISGVCISLLFSGFWSGLALRAKHWLKREPSSHFGIDGFLYQCVRLDLLGVITDMLLVNCIKVHLNLLSVDFLVLRHGPLYFRIFELESLSPALPFLIKELKPWILSKVSSEKNWFPIKYE